jgi:hypothetical protein
MRTGISQAMIEGEKETYIHTYIHTCTQEMRTGISQAMIEGVQETYIHTCKHTHTYIHTGNEDSY